MPAQLTPLVWCSMQAKRFKAVENSHRNAARELNGLSASCRRTNDADGAEAFHAAAVIHTEKAEIVAEVVKAFDEGSALISASSSSLPAGV